MCYRILQNGTRFIFENAKDMKHYASMFNEIEDIFQKLGFDDDVSLAVLGLLFVQGR
jgi:hypothetical protein